MKTKVIYIAFLLYLLSSINIYSQTIIQGGNVSGTWNLAGSPYLIHGPIQITDGSTLVVQPGVNIIFQGTYKFLILGQILAVGSVSDTITFTSANPIAGWRGIRFVNTPSTNDTSKFIYCKVQYSNTEGAPADINGGGFLFTNFSKAVISHCLISNNRADYYFGGSGGGIYCYDSSPEITNNTITGNTASFISNGNGGGIYAAGMCNPLITENIVSGNSAGYGGGIYAVSAIISNNTIIENFADYDGGGLFLGGYGYVVVRNNWIEGNFASGGWQGGGGIFVELSNTVIEDNTIINNISSGIGGGGIYCQASSKIRRNIIANNEAVQAINGYGGGIYIDNLAGSYAQELSSNILANNYALNGGGIYIKSANCEMNNNLIVNNDAINGGGVYCCNGSNPTFRNCIIWGNTANNYPAQIFLFDEPSDPVNLYCDIEGGLSGFNTNGNFYSGTFSNNMNIVPQFISPSSGSGTTFNGYEANWSIPSGSPCVDSGDPLTIGNVTDLNGNPRVSGCSVDLGPYEIQVNGSLGLTINTINESSFLSCDGSATAIVTQGVPPYSYEWSTGAATSSVTDLCGGTYTITVTDGAGCIRKGLITISNLLGTEDGIAPLISFSFYPNPASDHIIIKQENPDLKNLILTIYKSMGEKILLKPLERDQERINTSRFENGLYILVVGTDGQFNQQKLIIQR